MARQTPLSHLLQKSNKGYKGFKQPSKTTYWTVTTFTMPYYMAWLNSNVECGLLFLDKCNLSF